MTPLPRLRTPLTDLVGSLHPVVQTGMGFVSDARLTAATSSAGAFGILAGATMGRDELVRSIDEIQAATDASFGVNLRADQPDVTDRLDLLARRGVRVASFALAPRQDLLERCADLGLVSICSAGARRHAEKVAAWGADAVIVQGSEGGGHTGTVPTSILLPDVLRHVDLPVIAAGGFSDGRGLAGALALGASGIAMGTRFLLTRESPVVDAATQHYLAADVDGTVVTTEVDGVPQRVLRTGVAEHLGRRGRWRAYTDALRSAQQLRRLTATSGSDLVREGLAMKRRRELTWHQTLLSAQGPMLYRSALLHGRVDVGLMASGQIAGVIDDVPTCRDLVDRVVAEAVAAIRETTALVDQEEPVRARPR